MPEAFKLLPVAEDKGPISMYPVHGKVHQVPDRRCSGLQSCTELGGAIAQQEAMNDNPRDSGDGKRDSRGLEDSEVVQKGAGTVGDSSRTGRPRQGASAVVRVCRKSGGIDGGNGVKHQ